MYISSLFVWVTQKYIHINCAFI